MTSSLESVKQEIDYNIYNETYVHLTDIICRRNAMNGWEEFGAVRFKIDSFLSKVVYRNIENDITTR